MDFFIQLLNAIVGGASAGLSGVATDVIKSSYDALKNKLSQSNSKESVEEIEKDIDAGKPVELVVEKVRKLDIDSHDDALIGLIRELSQKLNKLMLSQPELVTKLSLPLPAVLTEEEKAKIIMRLPIGPAVKDSIFSADTFSSAMARSVSRDSPMESAITIDRANHLRVLADPNLSEDSICLGDLPPLTGYAGLQSFWYMAADQAGRRGPRMVAALLLVCPISAWQDYGALAFHKLTSGERDVE